MFDIKTLASAISGMISEPIKKLADRIKKLEDRKEINEAEIVLKVTALLTPMQNALMKRLDELAIREFPELPDWGKIIEEGFASLPQPQDGKSITIEDVKPFIEEAIKSAISKIELPKAPELPDIEAMVIDATAAEVAELPKAPNIDDIKLVVAEIVKEQVSKIELPQAPELPDIAGMIEGAVKALPKPVDGKSISLDDVKPSLEEAIGRQIAAIPVAKDGVGLAGAIIDRLGHLVVTLTNGNTQNLGPVVGRDVDMTEVARIVAEKVAAIPRPKDGADGLGFEDLSVEYDGKRSFTIKFARGDKTEEFPFKLPHMIYHGVYEFGKSYEVGDTVTWSGSLYHCDKDTSSKPGEGGDWTLAAKRGTNGKEVFILPKKKEPVKV